MKYWTEMRTALTLARLGTVSAAASEMGVHRATVNRHIDTLEAVFGGPLFQRHARGYALTEAGQDMLQVASRVDEMLGELQGRSLTRSSQVSGKLIVTAVAGVAPRVMGAIAAFRLAHPTIDLEFRADDGLARLEYGEAHVAVRAGPKPTELDYVVRAYQSIRFGLYASKGYVAREGLPDLDNLEGHQFIAPMRASSATPYAGWLAKHVNPAAFAMRCNDYSVRRFAICHGIGIGFIDDQEAQFFHDLVELMPPGDEIAIDLWVVTHIDLHRSPKIQAFLDFLK